MMRTYRIRKWTLTEQLVEIDSDQPPAELLADADQRLASSKARTLTHPAGCTVSEVRRDAGEWPAEAGGVHLPPEAQRIVDTVSTYHAGYFGDPLPPGAEEHGEPKVPITIERCDGIRLLLGEVVQGPYGSGYTPCVLVERQTDRWMVMIQRWVGGDADIIAYITDDNHLTVEPDSMPDGNVIIANHHQSSPMTPPLPLDKLRFPLPFEVPATQSNKNPENTSAD
jgi:hypothetical protein